MIEQKNHGKPIARPHETHWKTDTFQEHVSTGAKPRKNARAAAWPNSDKPKYFTSIGLTVYPDGQPKRFFSPEYYASLASAYLAVARSEQTEVLATQTLLDSRISPYTRLLLAVDAVEREGMLAQLNWAEREFVIHEIELFQLSLEVSNPDYSTAPEGKPDKLYSTDWYEQVGRHYQRLTRSEAQFNDHYVLEKQFLLNADISPFTRTLIIASDSQLIRQEMAKLTEEETQFVIAEVNYYLQPRHNFSRHLRIVKILKETAGVDDGEFEILE